MSKILTKRTDIYTIDTIEECDIFEQELRNNNSFDVMEFSKKLKETKEKGVVIYTTYECKVSLRYFEEE